MVPFFGEQSDNEMIKVIKYINHIHERFDLREPNEKIFKLRKIFNSNIESYIKYYEFDQISNFSISESDEE